jgi:hypothetical protein
VADDDRREATVKPDEIDTRPIRKPRPATRTITERYAGATVDIPGGSVELGIQRGRGEPVTQLRAHAKDIVTTCALILNGDNVSEDTAADLSDRIDTLFAEAWPDRAWFIEIWNANDRLTQVYHRWLWPGDQSAD